MRIPRYLTALFLVCASNLTGAIPAPPLSLPALPPQYVETRLQQMQQAFEQRSVLFLKGRHFQTWRMNKPRADILKEFDQLNDWRFYTWYINPNAKSLVARTDFMIAQDLLEKGLYRKPALIAFQYNQTDATYNSSTILLNGFKFLVLEAPSARNLKNFFTLLQNHRVTQLIRLTPSEENGREKSYPYWNENRIAHTKANRMYLHVPQPYNPNPYRVGYYVIDSWHDSHGIHPKKLLTLIQAVRKDSDPNGLIACHSAYGGGRAGTFLAGFLLLNDIDRQINAGISKNALNISIEKIVMQLSLQRPYLVSTAEQYISLHRLVDWYLKNLP